MRKCLYVWLRLVTSGYVWLRLVTAGFKHHACGSFLEGRLCIFDALRGVMYAVACHTTTADVLSSYVGLSSDLLTLIGFISYIVG
jgi:hypothetical protein